MKGNKRKGRHPGTWELRVDAGRDPLTGRRQQKSVIFDGTSREADVALAELDDEAGTLRIDAAIGETNMVYEKDTTSHQHHSVTLSPFALEWLLAHGTATRRRARCAASSSVPTRSCSLLSQAA